MKTCDYDGQQKRWEHGFTLIELLTVIAIIGILAGLLLPTLGRAKQSAHSVACLSNLHQIGIAMELYTQDNEHRLPTCAQMPSTSSNLPPIMTALSSYLQSPRVFKCLADRTYFDTEKTSYEWNSFLNGASYDHPEEWSLTTKTIVDTIFGGRLYTPLVGDAGACHPKGGTRTGKNALYFDCHVQSVRSK